MSDHSEDDPHEASLINYEYKKGDNLNLLSHHIEYIVDNNFNL